MKRSATTGFENAPKRSNVSIEEVKENIEVLNNLIEKGNSSSYATQYASQIVKLLNKKDISTILTTKFDHSMLHAIILDGNLCVVKYIVDNCLINPTAYIDAKKHTILSLAAQYNQVEIIDYLLKQNIFSQSDVTEAAFCAARYKSLSGLELLMNNGAILPNPLSVKFSIFAGTNSSTEIITFLEGLGIGIKATVLQMHVSECYRPKPVISTEPLVADHATTEKEQQTTSIIGENQFDDNIV